jgi:hypothetical protein
MTGYQIPVVMKRGVEVMRLLTDNEVTGMVESQEGDYLGVVWQFTTAR